MNAGSGRVAPDDARRQIEAALAQAGRRHEVLLVDRPGRLPAVAQRAVEQASAQQGVVVAAGGDGTLNAVAAAVLPSGRPYGVVPLGTFNYFARGNGIPTDTAAAAALLTREAARPVQVGLMNERVFLVNASLGLYPQLLQDREAFKRRYGRNRIVAGLAALSTLLGRHPQLRIVIEDDGGTQRSLRTPTLFVGNNRLQLERIGLEEGAAVQHGRLVAITPAPVGPLGMLGLVLRGAAGRLGAAEEVASLACRELAVAPVSRYRRGRMKYAIDGEVGQMRPPIRFQVAAQPLMLIKPAEHGLDSEDAD
ncbi:diacylglycerol/lipid kinase family protein [Methylibium sp.]|uniref:diacylglycerol/lipid kinase family protein n=1 Tax=Methylibium sp. TaxID=2067992 RepID=UPI0039C93C93